MKNQKGFGAIEALLILVIVGIIGGVGYYVYNANKQEPKISDSTIHKNAATGSPEVTTAQKNSGWLVYNSDLGFFIEYPEDWDFVLAGTTIDGGTFSSDEFIPASELHGDNSKALFIEKEKTNLTLREYVDKSGVEESTEGDFKLISSESSTINGYEAHTTVSKIHGGTNYFVHVANNGVVVSFHYLDNKDLIDTYKKIIESIVFTN